MRNLNTGQAKVIAVRSVEAYVVFKYKDGSHSFDYMTRSEIDKVRARSKSGEDGPWGHRLSRDGQKKTVIKRHVKLAPLSVEFQQAVALEDPRCTRRESDRSHAHRGAGGRGVHIHSG